MDATCELTTNVPPPTVVYLWLVKLVRRCERFKTDQWQGVLTLQLKLTPENDSIFVFPKHLNHNLPHLKVLLETYQL